MNPPGNVGNLCRYIINYHRVPCVDEPGALGSVLREYTGIHRTPNLGRTISLVRSLGITIEAVSYLNSGGTNMMAKGQWYIHYSASDRPATQKFTIFHELFEIIHKNLNMLKPDYTLLKEPQISRYADRFAASFLIPPRYFSGKAAATGCDLVRLAEDLELSHQCLLIALGQHFLDIPFVGVLYENRNNGDKAAVAGVKDFIATVVVKTPRARRIKELCGLQTVPTRKSHPLIGSLVCASIAGGRSLLWRNTHVADSAAILVRPLLSSGREPYRVILIAVPSEEFGLISSQVERIEPIKVNGDALCPSVDRCLNSDGCLWKAIGGYDEH